MPITKKRNHFLYPGLRFLDDGEFPTIVSPTTAADPPDDIALYIGVPYCRVKCHECPFFSSYQPNRLTRKKEYAAYFDAVRNHLQIAAAHGALDGETAAVYVGGGTPTVVDIDHIEGVIAELRELHLEVNELTLEGNPEDFTSEYVKRAGQLGATRISLGVQSFDDETLAVIGSPHRATQALTALSLLRNEGDVDLNVDLMYGVPGQTVRKIENSLHRAAEFDVPGITWYPYTFQPEGMLGRATRGRRASANPSPSAPIHETYVRIRRLMAEHNYEERMIGAFFRPGHRLIYSEVAYQRARRIVGVGSRAYTFDGAQIHQCPPDPANYVRAVARGVYPVANRWSGALTPTQILARRTILGLLYGAIPHEVAGLWLATGLAGVFANLQDRWKKEGLLHHVGGALELTEVGAAGLDSMLENIWEIGA